MSVWNWSPSPDDLIRLELLPLIGHYSGGVQPENRRWFELTPADVVDVFVYVVILNLAVQFLPRVLTESFTISLLTAILLKVVLEVVVAIKKPLLKRFSEASGIAKVVIGLLLWGLLVGSKFAVLGLVAILFGDLVSLGGFFPVTGLILVLMAARALVRRVLEPAKKPATDWTE